MQHTVKYTDINSNELPSATVHLFKRMHFLFLINFIKQTFKLCKTFGKSSYERILVPINEILFWQWVAARLR